MFSNVVDPIVDGLKDWAKGIKTQMQKFFSKLSNWDDGDGNVEATMQAGTGLMLSFVGMQDKAKQVTDVLSEVMNYIKPFQKYISPMGAMGVIADSLGGSIPAVGNLFDTVENAISDGVSMIVETFMGLAESIAGDTPLPDGFDMELPTMDAIQNFLDAAGISNTLIDGVIDGVSSFVGDNAGSILGYAGFALTLLSISHAAFFGAGGAARVGSLIVGGISAAIEFVTILGSSIYGWFGIGAVVGLGVFGFAAGLWTLILYGAGLATSGTSPVETVLIGADVGIDFTGFWYSITEAS